MYLLLEKGWCVGCILWGVCSSTDKDHPKLEDICYSAKNCIILDFDKTGVYHVLLYLLLASGECDESLDRAHLYLNS